jgi:hypothetical protein
MHFQVGWVLQYVYSSARGKITDKISKLVSVIGVEAFL